MPVSPKPTRVEVADFRELSPSVVLLRLQARGAQGFSWLAGQHVWISREETGTLWVPYSIASYADPRRPGEFELAVSREGDKHSITELGVGASLFVSAAAGSFIWQSHLGSSLFVGIGTGVAPLRAMLHAALDVPTERAVALLFGARSDAHVLWNTEFSTLAERDPRFRFEPTLSQADSAWPGRRGRVQSHLDELVSAFPDAFVYICGNTSMVADSIARLVELGLDPARISSEAH